MTGQTDTDIATLRDILYGYSLRDNLTSATDLLDAAENVAYGYDPRQMLELATGPWGTLDWAYDPVGNRASEKLTPPGAGGNPKPWNYTYESASNRLTRIKKIQAGTRAYTHDGAGNTIAESSSVGGSFDWDYGYNLFGRLASVDLNGIRQADYLYNALGQQVSRDVGGVVTVSVHDLNGNRIAEHDDTGAVLREYIWLDGRPLAAREL